MKWRDDGLSEKCVLDSLLICSRDFIKLFASIGLVLCHVIEGDEQKGFVAELYISGVKSYGNFFEGKEIDIYQKALEEGINFFEKAQLNTKKRNFFK